MGAQTKQRRQPRSARHVARRVFFMLPMSEGERFALKRRALDRQSTLTAFVRQTLGLPPKPEERVT